MVEGQEAKAERAVESEATVHPAPIPLYPTYCFSAAIKSPRLSFLSLMQDGILGTLFFITGCIFALSISSEGLGSRPQQQNSTTRTTQSVAGDHMAGKSLTVGKVNFPNLINLSDEVLQISLILIGLNPLSC